MTGIGDPIAYYIGWSSPPYGAPCYGKASVERAQDRHVYGDGYRLWSGPFETLAKVNGWIDEPSRRLMWRYCLAHYTGRRIRDDELDAWLDVHGHSLRVTTAEIDTFFDTGIQLELL